jgi:hypothetical protein
MGEQEMKFVVFVIHALAEAWSKSSGQVYKKLNDTGILDNYIVSCYDVLHTLGKQYLIQDITDFVKEKGIEI